jgi:CHAD domain-containing protein
LYIAFNEWCLMESKKMTLIESLEHFYTEQAYHFSAAFMNCRTGLTNRAIHDLRLALKNLNALVQMLMEMDTSRRVIKFDMPPRLERLFKLLGAIRDLQNLESELKKQEKKLKTGFGKFRKHFKKQKLDTVKKLGPLLGSLEIGAELLKIREYMEKVLRRYGDEEILKKKIVRYVEKSWTQIRQMLKARHTVRNLHAIRISLKHLYYILSVVKSDKEIIRNFPFRIELLDPFQELLGNWHDSTVFRDKIRNIAGKKGKRHPNLMKISFLESNIAREQMRLKRFINGHSGILLEGNTSVGQASPNTASPPSAVSL